MPVEVNYLFVNKHVNSRKLTRSQGPEKSNIFRHVQQGVADRPAPVKEKYFHTDEWSIDASPTRMSNSYASTSCSRTSHTVKDKCGRKRPGSKKTATRLPFESRSPLPVSCESSPFYREIGVELDPFHSSNVPFTPRVHYLLRIYNSDIAPTLFPTESVAVPSRHYTLSLALRDPLMHYSFLSFVSTRMYSCTGNDVCRLSAMTFKHKALVHVRRLISNPEGDPANISNCYAIATLIWVECLIGNCDDLKAHSSGLQYLMRAVHDACSIHIYILRLIHACAYLCAALLDIYPPALPVQTIDEAHLSLKARAVLKASQTPDYEGEGHAFFRPAGVELLGPSLTPSAITCQKVALIRKMLEPEEHPSADVDVRYTCLTEMAVEHDLLVMHFDGRLNPCQDAIRLALFIMSSLPLIAATGPSAAISKALAKQIRSDIEQDGVFIRWAACPDILLWVLTIGAFVSRNEAEWPWFANQILMLIDQLELKSLFDLKTTLSGCFYSRYLQETVQSIWRERDSRVIPLAIEALLTELPSSPLIP